MPSSLRFAPALLACSLATLHGQNPSGPANQREAQPVHDGNTLIAKVEGDAMLHTSDRTRALKVGDAVPAHSAVSTGPGAEVVLVFSNGATIHLGAQAELRVDTFRQAPFSGRVTADAGLPEEPSESETRLWLSRGKLTAAVKTRAGSTFVIATRIGDIHARAGTFAVEMEKPADSAEAVIRVVSASAPLTFVRASGSNQRADVAPGESFTLREKTN